MKSLLSFGPILPAANPLNFLDGINILLLILTSSSKLFIDLAKNINENTVSFLNFVYFAYS